LIMDNNNGHYLKNRTILQSFKNATSGFYQAVLSERNLKIHLCAVILVIAAGIFFRLEPVRWAVLVLTIGLVLISELLNTSIEKLTNMITTEYSDKAKKVKDIGSSAVFISTIISVIVGILIFYQPFSDWIKNR
jgi:diacylglycerol kinase